MSLYRIMHGVNPVTFFVLPLLGKHPEEYPRFRDSFIGDPERDDTAGKLILYTRTGGGNREAYEEDNTLITEMDGFLFDYDDDFDCTFANWVFDIPEKWVDDISKWRNGKLSETSKEYQDKLIEVFPKLKEKLTEAFNPTT